ncbi:class I SAM-dependent methyltransferase [Dankookia rubra]|uniref:Class I SAM-dependent methyltransferase n=1 Tax=Dankookia rubra TaxID=1442381 RepID=A0A4R5QNW9_9PROT|nr:class I SAM-dependent methyltransferase [Dankookia rubra]TDH64518.1 class I SAM-dependent methyltransferase [Dankookia rubra]
MQPKIDLPVRKHYSDHLGLSFFDLSNVHYRALVSGMTDENRWHFEHNNIESHLSFLQGWAPQVVQWSASLPFPPGSVHLDLGAGEGNLCYILAKRGYNSIAVELSATILHSATLYQESIRRSAPNNSHLNLWVADIYDLPLDDSSVDFVTIKEVLHHLENLDGLFQEISRVLKPNGVVYIWEPFYPSFGPLRWHLSTYVKPREIELGIHHIYHSYDDYNRLFDKWMSNFSIERRYHRTKIQHYLTRSRFFQGSIFTSGQIKPYDHSRFGEPQGRHSDRVQIKPADFLHEELLPKGLAMTRRRREYLDSLFVASS